MVNMFVARPLFHVVYLLTEMSFAKMLFVRCIYIFFRYDLTYSGSTSTAGNY